MPEPTYSAIMSLAYRSHPERCFGELPCVQLVPCLSTCRKARAVSNISLSQGISGIHNKAQHIRACTRMQAIQVITRSRPLLTTGLSRHTNPPEYPSAHQTRRSSLIDRARVVRRIHEFTYRKATNLAGPRYRTIYLILDYPHTYA